MSTGSPWVVASPIRTLLRDGKSKATVQLPEYLMYDSYEVRAISGPFEQLNRAVDDTSFHRHRGCGLGVDGRESPHTHFDWTAFMYLYPEPGDSSLERVCH